MKWVAFSIFLCLPTFAAITLLIEGTPGPPPGIWVDSVAGSDSNIGTSNSPFATLAKAQTYLIAGTNVCLKNNSFWREKLTTGANNVIVSNYGSGNLPLIACDDIITASGWSNTIGNVWQKAVTWQSGTTWFRVWENTNRMVRATNVSQCASTVNSYYPSSDSTSPIQLYIHASDNSNPNSSGKVYEGTLRDYGIDASGFTGTTIRGIAARRNGANDGSVKMSGQIYDSDLIDGGKHNMLLAGGSTASGCRFIGGYYDVLGDGRSPLVFNDNVGTGQNNTVTNCLFSEDLFSLSTAAIISHLNVSGNYGTTRILSCMFSNTAVGLEIGSDVLIVSDSVFTKVWTGLLTEHYGMFVTNTVISADQSSSPRCVYIPGNTYASTNFFVNCSFSNATYVVEAEGSTAKVYINNCRLGLGGARPIYSNSGTPIYTVTSNTFLASQAWYIQSTNQAIADYNSYINPSSFQDAFTTYNFGQWQALGKDTHSTSP